MKGQKYKELHTKILKKAVTKGWVIIYTVMLPNLL